VVEADDGAADDDNEDDVLYYEDDGEDGDGRDGMSEEEVAELDESLVPVQLMLTKVSEFKLSLFLSNPNQLESFELSQTQSRIHQQLSSPSGLKSLRNWTSTFV
jgi:hypothetical protein